MNEGYKKRMLQPTVFINKTRMPQRTNAKTNSFINKIRILQRTDATTKSLYL
jgi:hypothetical protein